MTKKKKTDSIEATEETSSAPPTETPPSEAEAKVVDPAPPELGELDATAKPFEHWAAVHATPAWLLAGARVGLQWPRGREMTEKDFLAGIEWAEHAPCR